MSGQEELLIRIQKEFIAPVRAFIDLNFSSIIQDREDTLQEILEKLVTRLYLYDSRYALSTWVYSVARNHCLDLLRKQKRAYPIYTEDPDRLASTADSPMDLMEDRQDRDRIRYLLSKLPGQERQVLFLKYYEEMTYREIAQVMNRPVGTVKYLAFRGKSWMEAHWEAAV